MKSIIMKSTLFNNKNIMATKVEKIALYSEEIKKFDANPDLELLEKITGLLWPSIFNKDAETVACTDEAELERVLSSSVIEKLGLKVSMADAKSVCEKMGKSNRNKYRAIFYYLLAK